VKPHVVPLQVGAAFAGGVQAVQEAPQESVLVSETQAPPQA
jgi:hypothetical protein